jgi:hypothetical protein
VSACQCVRNKSSSNSHSTGTWKIREMFYKNVSLVTNIHSCNDFGADTVPKSGTEICVLRLAILTEICRGFSQHSVMNIRDIALNRATVSIAWAIDGVELGFVTFSAMCKSDMGLCEVRNMESDHVESLTVTWTVSLETTHRAAVVIRCTASRYCARAVLQYTASVIVHWYINFVKLLVFSYLQVQFE